MTAQHRPISFIATTKPDAALVFYSDVIGLTLLERSPYALVFQDGGTMLRVQIVPDLPATSHTVHGWQVHDIETAIGELALKGVEFLMFEQLSQSVTGVWTTPDGHKIAWFRDPDRNILSLSEFSRVQG